MCHYPYKSWQTGRPIKKTPFYDRCTNQGAVYKEISGWEIPDWFGLENHIYNSSPTVTVTIPHTVTVADNPSNSTSISSQIITSLQSSQQQQQQISLSLLASQYQIPSYTFDKPYFFENWKLEHNACRNSVVMFDMSFMSKFHVIGAL